MLAVACNGSLKLGQGGEGRVHWKEAQDRVLEPLRAEEGTHTVEEATVATEWLVIEGKDQDNGNQVPHCQRMSSIWKEKTRMGTAGLTEIGVTSVNS